MEKEKQKKTKKKKPEFIVKNWKGKSSSKLVDFRYKWDLLPW